MRSRTSLVGIVIVGALLLPVVGTVTASGAHPPVPPNCSEATPENCLYESNLSFDVGIVRGVLTDPDRDDYPVPLLVRYPVDASGPRPVVIWHHGGNIGLSGRNRSAEWGDLLASAGYVVIHPARIPIQDPAPFLSECEDNGYVGGVDCTYFISQWRYGAMNTDFLIANLDDIEALDPALDGMLNTNKIAVGAHSAGSASALANAGAWQQWEVNGPRYETRSEAPMAFLSSGPQGPMYAGFNSGFQAQDGDSGFDQDSYVGIDRPYMFVSGMGDETNEPSVARTTGFFTSEGSGDKFLVWDSDRRAVHETMDIHKCDSALQQDHCLWIGSAGLAFFDAIVRNRQVAKQWLRSDAMDILSGDVIEIHNR